MYEFPGARWLSWGPAVPGLCRCYALVKSDFLEYAGRCKMLARGQRARRPVSCVNRQRALYPLCYPMRAALRSWSIAARAFDCHAILARPVRDSRAFSVAVAPRVRGPRHVWGDRVPFWHFCQWPRWQRRWCRPDCQPILVVDVLVRERPWPFFMSDFANAAA